MFLKEVQILNFGIIKEAHILFSESNPIIGIVAKYEAEEDSGRSNRGGKTTFIQAIEYLLFGKARTRHHSKLINRTAKAAGEGMEVRGVYVLQDGREIEIVRSRTNDGKGTASVTGYEGSGWKEVTEVIEELIGFSHDEYKNTSYFSQGDIHVFMKSGPKEKRVLLLDWLNQTRWETRSEFSKQKAEQASNKVNQLIGTLNALPEPEGDPDELAAQAKEATESTDAIVVKRNRRREKLKALEVEYKKVIKQANLRIEKKRLTLQVKEVEEALEEAEQNSSKKLQLEEEIRSERNRLKEIKEGQAEDLEVVRNTFMTARDADKQAQKRYDAVNNTGGICPVLNESCERIDSEPMEKLAQLTRETVTEYERTKDEYNSLKNNHDEVARLMEEGIASIERVSRKLGNTDTKRFEQMLDRFDSELEIIVSKLKPETRSVTEINYDKTEVSEEIESLNRQIGKYSAEAVSFYKAAERARKYGDRKKRIETNLEDARLDFSTWKYCAHMFGDRGIPNEFIKGAFESLETDINYILGRMNCGLSIEFKPYRETKNFEPGCLVCGSEFDPRERKCSICKEPRQRKRVEQLVLIIHDEVEGTESDFDLDSGGGQVLISFAVRLALLFFKIRQDKGETPPIILDEVVGMLDPVNRSAIMDIVVNILTEEYNVKQVFWISHNPEILDLIEHGLVVTRFSSHSTVDWQ